MTAMAPPITAEEWRTANASYLEAEAERLRLLMRRRILWLRQRWQRNTAQGYIGWAISDQEADILLAGDERQDKHSFYQADPAAVSIGRALDDISQQLSEQRASMEAAGTPAALDILAARFELTPFARDVVLLCLAPELDPAFERVYAYLHDDAARKFATPHLALTLLATGELAGPERATFLPEAPLRRWRLITVEANGSAALTGRSLRIDERLVDYLLGINRLDERCHRLVCTSPESQVSSCQRELATRLALWLGTESKGNKLLNLIGRPDSGRLAIAQAACKQAGLNLLNLDPHALWAASSERGELIALLEREAILLGLILYLDQDGLKPDEAHSLMREMERCTAPIIIASRERVSSRRETLAIPVTRPDASSQSELWRRALGGSALSLNGDVDMIVEQFDFGPSGIARTVALAESQAALRRPGAFEPNLEDLWQACQQQMAAELGQLAKKVEPCYDWDDIVVPADVLRQLREITGQVALRHLVYQGWGFGNKLSRGRGISALFSGSSGVGKTMAAEVMARHLKLDLYRIDLAGVVSKYVGDTEKNLCCVFDAAERSGAILFFDEADALFGKRSEVKDSHDRYANIEVNYLLQRMEDYRGLAILATNMKSALDTAFMRRLRFIVDFPFPDAAQRTEIWRKVFPPSAAIDRLDYGVLSRLEIPGGNIRNIAVNAAFLAAGERAAIGMDHVMSAARREYTKVDRLVMDGEFGRYARVGAQL
jgi:hypothetical protein